MSLPIPPVPLKHHCSVIYKNTLYTFQADAFQSLPLSNNAQWSQLPMGVSVDGGRCVLAPSDGQDALFIVGGTSNSSTANYPGLQRYIFANQTWIGSQPHQSVTQNRQMHGAALLNSTSTILIYSGFQDNSFQESTQTFTISTSDPNVMRSFPSDAPPVINPLILPWNQSHAVLIGGDPTNQAVWTFSEADRWGKQSVVLPSPLNDTSHVQGAILDGSDGSKVLQLFDMSQSPNGVQTLVLLNATTPSVSGRGLQDRSWHGINQRRDLLPPYNSTLAPNTVRRNFSLAQGPSGLIVISGGTTGGSDAPLAIFNQTANSWVDPVQLLSTPPVPSSIPSPTSTSPTSSLTAGAVASSTAATAAQSSGSNNTLVILGATLGAVFGFAAICIVTLLILRYLRLRKTGSHTRKSSGFSRDAKNHMDFADRGAPDFIATPGTPFGRSYHKPTGSGESDASVYVTGGSGQPTGVSNHKAGDSNSSAKSIFGRNKSPIISAPIPAPQLNILAPSPERPQTGFASPEARTLPRTDEGWSIYNQANQQPGFARTGDESRQTTYTAASQSDYTGSRVASTQPRESAEVAPLNIRASQNPISDQGIGLSSYGNPSTSSYAGAIPEEENFLNGESSGESSWTPVATSERESQWSDKHGSSVYTNSEYYPHPGERVQIPNFPGVPTSNRTSINTVVPINDTKGLKTMASRDFAGGVAVPESKSQAAAPSSSKPFPRAAGDAYGASRTESDMSWLNLTK